MTRLQIAAVERRLEEHAAEIGASPPEGRIIIAQDGVPSIGIIA
ncbi:hypothetical protein [Boseongicola aestuarii]|uniref:Uncharacterized protein n=1 Tax=Boseongicola aestuarii TaxID=1470561 RepID=A0A238J5W6_9RHOB|nr:hypothetical protein [Boseongicola aestuarii]SMX25741.1 hypothetical protein BOA8489_03885 [Boseongicola aestuarii]